MKYIDLTTRSRQIAFGALVWITVSAGFVALNGCNGQPRGTGPDMNVVAVREAGLRAFADVASVVRSPRCINCHPAGEVPHQTDLHLAHFPAVRRGADDHGVTGMRCNACHQAENQPNGVPGAPHWGVAPRSMAWEGLDDHALAEQLKDPARNGHRTLAQMIEHVSSEKLVLWAWAPGGNRAPPPLTHEQFVQRFKDWVTAGAPSPETPHKQL